MFNRVGLEGREKYKQYSEQDWYICNRLQYHNADGDCSKCMAVVAECDRVCQDTGDKTAKESEEVERKFDLRIGDVEFWRNEVDTQVAGLQEAIDKLLQYKDRLQTALSSCSHPLNVTKQCLSFREKRLSIDLVNDKPQQQIQKYFVLLEDIIGLLIKRIEEVEEQIRVNRAVKHHLLRDVADKYSALQIDTHAVGSSSETKTPVPFHFKSDLLIPAKKSITVGEWESFTMHNIKKAEQERRVSEALHPVLDEILLQTYADLHQQHATVRDVIKDRIGETQQAKERMEERLARVVEQIEDIECTIVKLEQAIDHKIPILALAESRLEARRKRPRWELCRDSVDLELEKEVGQLTLTIRQLKDKLREAQEMLRKLKQTRLGLEKDIHIKTNSIYIDEVQCLTLLGGVAHIQH